MKIWNSEMLSCSAMFSCSHHRLTCSKHQRRPFSPPWKQHLQPEIGGLFLSHLITLVILVAWLFPRLHMAHGSVARRRITMAPHIEVEHLYCQIWITLLRSLELAVSHFRTWQITGWWFQPLKNMSSSVGMMKFTMYGGKKCSKPPTSVEGDSTWLSKKKMNLGWKSEILKCCHVRLCSAARTTD